MSYQQFLNATSAPAKVISAPSPTSSIHRKPAANSASSFRSVSPNPSTAPSQYSSLRQNAPSPSTPLSSFPPSSLTSSPIPYTHRQADSQATTSTTPSTQQPPEPTRPAPSASLTKPLSPQETDDALRACLRVQNTAVNDHGKRPFAALLLGPDNVTVLATHFSISHFQHAESELARLAATQYSDSYLAKCTLVSTWEPCAMCAGTLYWSGIGRLLYAASEVKLKELTGADNSENMTMALPCRTVLSSGQRNIEVIGPVSTWQDKVMTESGRWWKSHRGGTSSPITNKTFQQNGSTVTERKNSVSIYNPGDSVLGSIGEDGEYQADLKIDWMP